MVTTVAPVGMTNWVIEPNVKEEWTLTDQFIEHMRTNISESFSPYLYDLRGTNATFVAVADASGQVRIFVYPSAVSKTGPCPPIPVCTTLGTTHRTLGHTPRRPGYAPAVDRRPTDVHL